MRTSSEDLFSAPLAQARATLDAVKDAPAAALDTLGIVITGKADAGKTRLALKTLRDTLPEWTALVWSTVYQVAADLPPPSLYAGRDLVLIIDDLQDYAVGSQGSGIGALAGAGSLLRNLLGSLRHIQTEAGHKLAVVATCRSENLTSVRASLGWLLSELELVQIPEFSPDPNNPVSARVIAEMERRGRVFPQDWNGRIGSLVLGVEVSREQYALLDQAGSPAIPVLCAMKLLARSGVPDHTSRRVRAICSEIQGEVAIRDDLRVWRRAIEDLEEREFIHREPAAESDDEALVILRGTDFDEVVTCYRDTDPSLPRDRDALLGLFARLGDDSALFALGYTYYDEAAYARAIAAYDEVLRLDPDDAVTLNNKGVTLSSLKHYDEALAAFEQALTLDPTAAYVWYGKGAALSDLKRPKEALAAYEQALTLDLTAAYVWNGKGIALRDLKRPEEALAAYEQALTLDPTYNPASYAAGYVLLSLGKPSEALAAFELNFDAGDTRDWIAKATALTALGRYDDALAAYDGALTVNPSDADIWHQQVGMLQELKLYDAALTTVEAALMRSPDNANLWFQKGIALDSLHRYEETVAAYDGALARVPDDPVTLRNKADVLYEHLQRYDEALAAIQRAVELDDGSIRGWAILGDVERALGRAEEAHIAYERALALEASDSLSWFSRGRALAGLDRHDDALAAYDQYLTEDPNDAQVLHAKVRSLRALGRDAEADAVQIRIGDGSG